MKDEIIVSIKYNNKKFEFTNIKKLAYFVQDAINELEDEFEINIALLEREHALKVMELKKEIFALKKELRNEKRN